MNLHGAGVLTDRRRRNEVWVGAGPDSGRLCGLCGGEELGRGTLPKMLVWLFLGMGGRVAYAGDDALVDCELSRGPVEAVGDAPLAGLFVFDVTIFGGTLFGG